MRFWRPVTDLLRRFASSALLKSEAECITPCRCFCEEDFAKMISGPLAPGKPFPYPNTLRNHHLVVAMAESFLNTLPILLTPAFWFLSHPVYVSGRVIDRRNAGTPFQQSSDVWASVAANIAPLMALVGERNAKELMRTTSSWFQLLPISAAPIGILAILVSAIRLSGPGFLKRLVGRDSERRSEALVELTPLSVRPATSVYTPRAVEIEAAYFKDRVAFVCGHVRTLSCQAATESFQKIFNTRRGTHLEEDRDSEIILAMWQCSLPIEKVAELAERVCGSGGDSPQDFGALSTASLSYRATGISPSQTQTHIADKILSFAQFCDVVAFALGLSIMIGVQVLGMMYGGSTTKTLWMGVIGYLAMVGSTFALLMIVKAETMSEREILPKSFDKSVWTFSNSRHNEHKCMRKPTSNTLISARPANFSPLERARREILTSVVCLTIVGSYVTYYLSLRVAPWWVALSSLGAIWAGAAYRAVASPYSIISTGDPNGSEEYWIGMIGRNLSETLLSTIRRPSPRIAGCSPTTIATSPELDLGISTGGKEQDTTTQTREIGRAKLTTVLLVVPPARTSIGSWSGVEDVMKVGIEMAKRICQNKTITYASHSLAPASQWRVIARFNVSIYVPGMVWTSHSTTDFGLSRDFTLDGLIHLLIKILHVAMDQEGTLIRHEVDPKTSIELSHVLCGPISEPPLDNTSFSTSCTLRSFLSAMRDNTANATTRKFSVEQSVLLPTIQIASMFESLLSEGKVDSRIQGMQKSHIDNLRLSGAKWLGTLEGEFERLKIWDGFLVDDDALQTQNLGPRDATSGDYSMFNVVEEVLRGHDEGVARL